MEIIEEKTKGNKVLKIYRDDDAQSPREWDNVGKMVCFHKRYNLGDKTELSSDNFDGWDELEQYLIKEEKTVVILPLFLYDHSGISMSTSRKGQYACRWDSGQVGFIYTTKKQILECFGKKKLSKKLLKRAEDYLVGEIETYNQYLTGEVYGFDVVKKSTCKHCGETKEENIDSCWGFYGDDHKENGLYDSAGWEE